MAIKHPQIRMARSYYQMQYPKIAWASVIIIAIAGLLVTVGLVIRLDRAEAWPYVTLAGCALAGIGLGIAGSTRYLRGMRNFLMAGVNVLFLVVAIFAGFALTRPTPKVAEIIVNVIKYTPILGAVLFVVGAVFGEFFDQTPLGYAMMVATLGTASMTVFPWIDLENFLSELHIFWSIGFWLTFALLVYTVKMSVDRDAESLVAKPLAPTYGSVQA